MRKLFFPLLMTVLAGCASSDRMVRMSAGVFEEYSAPKSSRIRSEKYQKMSREFSSSRRANKVEIAGMNDTLVNIWPFFFRSNAYWTILWPFIDKDAYGFAIRPLYNHEGDDYSILFPLCAWNTAGKHGWVTLFGWNDEGFGFVPLTWQWKSGKRGGAYYTPLFIYKYDKSALEYVPLENYAASTWRCDDLFWEFCGFIYDRTISATRTKEWAWLYDEKYASERSRNLWNYHFDGKKRYPQTKYDFELFRKEIFGKLPREVSKTVGFAPLWLGTFGSNGDYANRFFLIAGNSKSEIGSTFDIAGPILAQYELERYLSYRSSTEKEETFTSWALMSHFETVYRYENTPERRCFDKLFSLINAYDFDFSRNKPEIEDTLKKLDPALKLPATVVDDATCSRFLLELYKKYTFPTYKEYSGMVLPLFNYKIKKDYSRGAVIPLLTWWKKSSNYSHFSSLPLMTFISREKSEESTVIFSPLTYYAKMHHLDREDYPVYPASCQRVAEYDCAELNDRYAALGLFYRGRFGFNVAKAGVDSTSVEYLRKKLNSMHRRCSELKYTRERLAKKRLNNDRWQTRTEIERLKKLICYEELKIEEKKLAENTEKFQKEVDNAFALAGKIGLKVENKSDLTDRDKAALLRKKLVADFSELRYYEDIGNGLFFRKEKNHNGDHNWHFCHILAGGEKQGDKESMHILHLLYRYRQEGKRSEMICFPFISSVKDGEDSRVSFLWRVFSLSKKNGKTGGHIFFIPFGCEW
ncbi:MAG: hypothetical protein IKB74_02880 [Lentisphaeria bacterium]|nr:hypothetical protein [Lentisphaeria bacterium]